MSLLALVFLIAILTTLPRGVDVQKCEAASSSGQSEFSVNAQLVVIVMAQNSAGIQKLLHAEKSAAEIVDSARKRKLDLLVVWL